jgi:hypothetical protein
MERASSGLMSELTKFAKYGMPYLAVTSQSFSRPGRSQSKSLETL